jgi:hypothetical protein
MMALRQGAVEIPEARESGALCTGSREKNDGEATLAINKF